MDLLYTLTAYPPSIGGAQLLQHHTAIRLAPRHKIQVVSHWDSNRSDWLLGTTLRAPEEPRDYVVDGIPVHRMGISRSEKFAMLPAVALYYPLMGLALRPISAPLGRKLGAFAEQADLIHNVRIGREGLSLASLHAARRHDVPFVLTPVHHPRWKGWRYRVYLQLYGQADAVIALTEAEKRILVGLGVDEGRIHVTGFGPILAEQVDREAFIARHALDGPMILFLGQHYLYKGYHELLQAAPLVWLKFPQARFAFIGRAVGGSEEAFRTQKDPRVLRLGEVSLQEKSDALAACTLLCVPSSQESFGGVYTEAWSYGKPVIGCSIPAVSEVITQDQDGLLVAQEPRAIADAICQLLASPSSAEAMGEAGRNKVQARYSWERLARLTERAYFEVVGTQPPASPSARLP